MFSGSSQFAQRMDLKYLNEGVTKMSQQINIYIESIDSMVFNSWELSKFSTKNNKILCTDVNCGIIVVTYDRLCLCKWIDSI